MANTEKLINLMQNYPVLYDASHNDYKNTQLKDKVWRLISETLNVSVSCVRGKWRNLRDTYFRHLKSMANGRPTRKKWIWFDQMHALQPNSQRTFNSMYETNVFQDNLCEDTLDSENFDENIGETKFQKSFSETNDSITFKSEHMQSFSDPLSNQSKERGKKRKHSNNQEISVDSPFKNVNDCEENRLTVNGAYDSLDLLFLAHAKVVKTFSGKLQAITKLKIAQVIMEQELLHYEELERNNK